MINIERTEKEQKEFETCKTYADLTQGVFWDKLGRLCGKVCEDDSEARLQEIKHRLEAGEITFFE